MQDLLDHFENHPIHNALNQVEVFIKNAENKEKLSLNQEECLEWFKKVFIKTKRVINSVDPFFVSRAHLDSINTYLSQIGSHFNEFIANENINYLNNMKIAVDRMLSNLSVVKNLVVEDDIIDLREEVISFRRSVAQHKRYMEDEQKKYINNIKNSYNEYKKSRAEIEDNLVILKNNIEKQKDRVDNIISQAQNQVSEFQSQFSNGQEKRINKFEDFIITLEKNSNSLVNDTQEKYEKLAKELKDKYNKEIESLKTEADDFVNRFVNYENDVKKIIGTISVNGLAAGYNKIANQEKRSKIIWQILTLMSMMAIVWYGIYFVREFKPLDQVFTEINWGSFTARIFVMSAMGALSTYTSKQAKRHSDAERYNRKMELELASIDPYLAVLPNDIIIKVKEELAPTFFGKDDSTFFVDEKDNNEVNPIILNVAKKAIKEAIK